MPSITAFLQTQLNLLCSISGPHRTPALRLPVPEDSTAGQREPASAVRGPDPWDPPVVVSVVIIPFLGPPALEGSLLPAALLTLPVTQLTPLCPGNPP